MGTDCNLSSNTLIGRRSDGQGLGIPTIGDRVWIGVGTVVFGNIVVGSGVTIAPLTVVGRNVPPRTLVVGNPMQVMKRDYDNTMHIYGKAAPRASPSPARVDPPAMRDEGGRRKTVPDARATALFARTIHRELRKAGYDNQDLVRFIGDLAGVTATNWRRDNVNRRLAGLLDPETGLPNRETFEEIVDFEIRRADEAGGQSLLLVCVEVQLPDWTADDVALAVYEHTASALARRLRADDVVARLPPSRYLVLLPNATNDLVLALCTRFGAELHGLLGAVDKTGTPRKALAALPPETRYTIGWLVRSESTSSAAESFHRGMHLSADNPARGGRGGPAAVLGRCLRPATSGPRRGRV